MRCCWSGARPSLDCGGGACSMTEVISVQMIGASDTYCNLEAPANAAGLSVLPPGWHEPIRQTADAAPAPAQMQLRTGTGNGPRTGFTGAWSESGPREVRRKLNFSSGDWDATLDYVPRGNTLWERRLEAEWADEEIDDIFGPRTERENVPFLLGEEM